MTTIYNLRASNNCTFHWTRDLSAFAAVYNLASATIRMQARVSPFASDPPVYEWLTGASSGGLVTFDPATNFVVFSAPEADMARMQPNQVYDCRLELLGGASVILFGGKIVWKAGITRATGDASATVVSGVSVTVSVDGENSSSPVPMPLSLSAALTATRALAATAQAAASTASASATMATTSASAVLSATLISALIYG